MAAGSNSAFKIAAKPLKIETAYRNSSSVYPTVYTIADLLRTMV